MSVSRCLTCGATFSIPGMRYSVTERLTDAEFLHTGLTFNDPYCEHCETLLHQLRAGKLKRVRERMPPHIYETLIRRKEFWR